MAEPVAAAGACALCGRPGRPLYRGLFDRLFDAPGTWSLERCSGCTLVWLEPRPSADQLAGHYRDYYTHDVAVPETAGGPARGGRESLFRRAITRGIAHTRLGYPTRPGDDSVGVPELFLAMWLGWIGPLREIAEHRVMWLPPEACGRVLDVGCGDGSFLSHARDLGWQIAGVEPDPAAADAARRRLGEDALIAKELGSPELEAASFDAITLSHVIEHLLEPAASLRECLRLLKPGGRLVCVTPNTGSLGARSFGEHWLHWDPPRHLTLYDAETLPRLVREAGFEIQRVATPASSAHFVWQASALLERRKRLPNIDLTQVSPALVLESIAFWAWEHLLTRFGLRCGEEVLVIASRADSR